ncbi:hypothetical protein [Aureimonas glaciei]|jgi:hypothetical protein|nr:hypothetical protein [Aureimonas glaciei]
MWIGRAYASVQQVGNLIDTGHVMGISRSLNSDDAPRRLSAAAALVPILYRNLAVAEMNAPAPARGAFIPAGNEFDAFAAIGRVLTTAEADALIVDPYMDERTLTDFAVLATEQSDNSAAG